ncbi:GtrA family protein [Curtobacterium sp. C1]|uniref:GtrA family protein n=1 Tax=Curtobacterium TaxID=2034 RepID=UPI001E5BAA9C|nr:GtrA family protein [Curtobacterium sp. C1]MCS5487484.1 GtrA family protein [Curtobacterium flaccumfaciens pv. basellae]UFU12997.1 GtrA family protein [Curtobacterium sp. C1]
MSNATGWFLGHLRRGGSFLVVGGVGFVVDAAVYNALVFWGGHGPLFSLPLVGKIIAIAVASVVTYFGSRLWTYRDRADAQTFRSFAVFALLNVVAILLQLGCLGFSRYVLHLDSPIADNVSGTLIGQAVATVFRYFAYGRWVFTARRDSAEEAVADVA